MRVRPPPATILIVDRDATVRRILGRVLAREGHNVLEAHDARRALQLAEQHHPQLALLDLCLSEGDSADLAGRLHALGAGVPLILITGYPPALHGDAGLARPFLRVLTKPFDLNELRRAVIAALREGAMQTPKPSPAPLPEPTPPVKGQPPAPAAQTGSPVHHTISERVRSAGVVVVALLMLAGFVIYVVGVPIPGLSAAPEQRTVEKPPPPKIEVLSRTGEPPTVLVPEDVRRSLGIRGKDGTDRLATVRVPTEARPLVLSGSTALAPAGVMRIRARFAPAEVVELGQVDDRSTGATTRRDLRSGDRVRKGDRLGTFYSVDVGNKKNDLMDALLQLKLDQEILAASKRAYDKGAIPHLDLLAAEKSVLGDHSSIRRWSCAPPPRAPSSSATSRRERRSWTTPSTCSRLPRWSGSWSRPTPPRTSWRPCKGCWTTAGGPGSSTPPARRPRASPGKLATSATSRTSTSTTSWSRATSPTRGVSSAAVST
jgi:CheY-like chemotaxis protein